MNTVKLEITIDNICTKDGNVFDRTYSLPLTNEFIIPSDTSKLDMTESFGEHKRTFTIYVGKTKENLKEDDILVRGVEELKCLINGISDNLNALKNKNRKSNTKT